MGKIKTREDFIQQVRSAHGDRYDYSKVEFINSSTKVTITCHEHGDFQQTPLDHSRGRGCAKCAGRGKTTEELIKDFRKIHGDWYKYNKVNYTNYDIKVIITCPEHGDFLQKATKHLRGNGCPECGNVKISNSKIEQGRRVRDWNFEQPEEYKLIPLSKGKFAKVDNEDFDRLKDINWCVTKQGYAINDSVGLMHRYIMNAPDHLEVDHIVQENTLDNRRINLRLATRPQNMANTRPRKGSSSIYKGVVWNKRDSNWIGFIMCNYKGIRLGYFADEIECAKAYDRKALELFGEFAYLNFPELKDEYLKELNYERL